MTLTVVLRVAPGGPALAINPPPPVPPATSSGSMMAPTTPGSTAQAPAPTSRGIISPIPAARRRPQRAHAKTAGAPLHVPLHARPRPSAQTAAQRVLCAASELPSPPPRLTIDAGSDAGAGALPGRHRRRLRGDVVTRTVASGLRGMISLVPTRRHCSLLRLTQATVAEPGLRCKGVVVGFGLSAVFWPQ